MAMTTLTIEIDEDELRRLNEVCAARGITVQEAVRKIARHMKMPAVFSKAAMKIRRKLYGPTAEEARQAFYELRAQALASPLADMSMEEIDKEIALARAEHKAKGYK